MYWLFVIVFIALVLAAVLFAERTYRFLKGAEDVDWIRHALTKVMADKDVRDDARRFQPPRSDQVETLQEDLIRIQQQQRSLFGEVCLAAVFVVGLLILAALIPSWTRMDQISDNIRALDGAISALTIGEGGQEVTSHPITINLPPQPGADGPVRMPLSLVIAVLMFALAALYLFLRPSKLEWISVIGSLTIGAIGCIISIYDTLKPSNDPKEGPCVYCQYPQTGQSFDAVEYFVNGDYLAEGDKAPVITRLYFGNESTDVAESAREELRMLAQALSACASERAPVRLLVSGHSSSAEYPSSSDVRNAKLAEARALSVKTLLDANLTNEYINVQTSGVVPFYKMVRGLPVDDRFEDDSRNELAENLNRSSVIRMLDAGECAFDN
ncbi:OmpA family protein [Hyphomonas sp.]|uniref:OmpA family protein n=1 Tax=Hyphomonas sp. TaxID=87 RepID=UPI000C4C97B9|nr:OmpA family protein [Hyphomonas sp.]MAU68688.1 hypothetical protein [Hyphomonas sp.]MBM59231.1 hypothetical protein [Hyphomonas sp.]